VPVGRRAHAPESAASRATPMASRRADVNVRMVKIPFGSVAEVPRGAQRLIPRPRHYLPSFTTLVVTLPVRPLKRTQ